MVPWYPRGWFVVTCWNLVHVYIFFFLCWTRDFVIIVDTQVAKGLTICMKRIGKLYVGCQPHCHVLIPCVNTANLTTVGRCNSHYKVVFLWPRVCRVAANSLEHNDSANHSTIEVAVSVFCLVCCFVWTFCHLKLYSQSGGFTIAPSKILICLMCLLRVGTWNTCYYYCVALSSCERCYHKRSEHDMRKNTWHLMFIKAPWSREKQWNGMYFIHGLHQLWSWIWTPTLRHVSVLVRLIVGGIGRTHGQRVRGIIPVPYCR